MSRRGPVRRERSSRAGLFRSSAPTERGLDTSWQLADTAWAG